jgi:hypothetical protein
MLPESKPNFDKILQAIGTSKGPNQTPPRYRQQYGRLNFSTENRWLILARSSTNRPAIENLKNTGRIP